MKKNKNKTDKRRPEVETPRPPQVIDPSRPPQQDQEATDNKINISNEEGSQKSKTQAEESNKNLLGESPTEIDDETTI